MAFQLLIEQPQRDREHLQYEKDTMDQCTRRPLIASKKSRTFGSGISPAPPSAAYYVYPPRESDRTDRTALRNVRRQAQQKEVSPFSLPTDSNEKSIVVTAYGDCGASGKILQKGKFLDRRTSALVKTSDARLLESRCKRLHESSVDDKHLGARRCDVHLEEGDWGVSLGGLAI